MGVVDAEYPHALGYPVIEDALQLRPQALPIAGLEVERIDVLVFLGRILRVLDAAVGPVTEPFGMLGHVRVVRRALKRDVERDGYAVRARRLDQPAEVLGRSELRVDRLVAAFPRADRPRAARFARARGG